MTEENPFVAHITELEPDPETGLTAEQDARVERLVLRVDEYLKSPEGEKVKKLAKKGGRIAGLRAFAAMYNFFVKLAKEEKYTPQELHAAFELWKLRNDPDTGCD